MDYFTDNNNSTNTTSSNTSNSGNTSNTAAVTVGEQRIDYAAFCSFCEHRPQETSVAIQRLQKMAFHRGSLDVFTKYDLQGRGSCSRVDLAESLREVRTSIHNLISIHIYTYT
jgi:hypothetical protein